MIATYAELIEDWSRIRKSDCPLVIEERSSPLSDETARTMFAKAPFNLYAEGRLAEALDALADDIPPALSADITRLAERFMDLMRVDAIRLRVEGITGNACKKVHADYTDVRLITTYAGPGTDYAPHGDGDCCLERVPTGAIALFKGRLFNPDHAPCMHRSPPIEGSGEARLVVVIDTPLKPSQIQ